MAMPAGDERDRLAPPPVPEHDRPADGDLPVWPVLILSLAARIAVILPQAPSFPGMGTPFDQYAIRIAAGYGYGPSSLLPPLYSYFLAMLYRVYGYSHHAVVLSQAIVGSIAVVASLLIARAAGLRGWRLYAAGWAAALFPGAVAEVRHLTPVLLASALFSLGLWIWIRNRNAPGVVDAVISGLLLGGAILVRTGIILPVLLVALAPLGRPASPRGTPFPPLARRALLLAAVIIGVAPWTIRNSRLHDRPALTESTWALRLRPATIPGAAGLRTPSALRDLAAPDNLVLSDNDLAAWDLLGYFANHPGEALRTWTGRAGRMVSLRDPSGPLNGDPFPYREPWYRVLQAAGWGVLLLGTLAWIILQRAGGRAEQACILAAAAMVLMGVLTATPGDARTLLAPLLAVTAARGMEAIPAWPRLGRARRAAFLALALAWIASQIIPA